MLRRFLAVVLLAPAVLLTPLGGAPSYAEPEPDAFDGLRWEVSAAYDATMETHTLAAGATEDDLGVVSFPYVSGTYDTQTGESSVTYTGSVTAKDTEPLLPPIGLPFPLPGFGLTLDIATVTIADPVVTTDLDGNGKITALVSSSNPTGRGGPASRIAPARVEVVSFGLRVDPWTDGTARGQLVHTPVEFSRALNAQVVAPARKSFGTEPDARAEALPSLFTAAAPPAPVLSPLTTVVTTATTPTGGVSLRVEGTGFRGVTRSGDTGVRVGLAPRDARPDVTTDSGLALFAAVVEVPAAEIIDHAFRATLTVPTGRLDATKSYAVYTWQAPTHSTTSQDTVTPVDLQQATALTTSARHFSTYGAGGRLVIGLPDGATGSVTVRGLGATRTLKLANNTATLLVALGQRVGSYRPSISYSGDGGHAATTATTYFTVRKAMPRLRVTRTSAGRVAVRVVGPASVAEPSGRVVVNGRSVRLGFGRATLTVPTAARRFVVRYSGAPGFWSVSATVVRPARTTSWRSRIQAQPGAGADSIPTTIATRLAANGSSSSW